jgi:SecD/SecF fusion protein
MLNAGFNWSLIAQAVKTPPEPSGMSGWLLFLIIMALFILPFVFGSLLARWLKLKDLSSKIGTILLAVTLGLTPFVWSVASGEKSKTIVERLKDTVNYGIDLAGGTNLVFEVDHAKLENEKKVTDEAMNQMVGVITKRINPGGVLEMTVRRVGFDRVEVIIPGADLDVVEQIKKKITKLGSLEFGILANNRDHADIILEAKKLTEKQKQVRIGERIVAVWREVGRKANGEPKQIGAGNDFVVRTVISPEDGKSIEEFLVIREREEKRVTGEYLTNATSGMDPDSGEPIVRFNFNSKGGSLFYQLTGDNLPSADESFHRRLSILLDGNVHSAPNIITRIRNQGQISGGFSRDEVDELVSVLKAGALEVPLKRQPISEMTVTPTMGQDVRTKGINAIMIAGAVVLVFMMAYYLFAGMVADLCLALNLILVLGVMALIHATFTLPGLAGLVLTIGMAVDANVLIFERIREETHRGSSLRMAIQNGFAKAFTTIVDANITTLIVAVVLYLIGTNQVRGFAVTLFIGIVMSMFTSLYFGRLIFDIWERKRWLTKLKMFSIVGATNWNFVSKKNIAAVVSLVLIGIGMSALFVRGEKNLDIDFTGGTMVTFEFEEEHETGEVRAKLEKEFDSVALERITFSDDPEPEGDTGTRFRLRTTMQDDVTGDSSASSGDTVVGFINKAFEKDKDKEEPEFNLRTVTIDFELIPEKKEGEKSAVTGSEFAGGQLVDLKFSHEVSLATVTDSLSSEIEKLKNEEGLTKYEQADTLFDLNGIRESDSKETKQPRFKKVQLQVRPELSEDDLKTALASLQQTMEMNPLFEEVNTFDSSVAGEMKIDAITAMLASLVAIVAYIWFRFQQITFGLAAVVALVHDVLIVLGMVALASYGATELGITALGLQEFKINLPMVAAFLTIVGYSLNDTIVVFDRIREVRGKNPAMTNAIVNTSLNQTLSRTLLTSLTTFFVVMILYAIGGEGIHGFAFCLVLGVIVGTYSSIYVASPVLIWLMNRPGSASAKATAAQGR